MPRKDWQKIRKNLSAQNRARASSRTDPGSDDRIDSDRARTSDRADPRSDDRTDSDESEGSPPSTKRARVSPEGIDPKDI